MFDGVIDRSCGLAKFGEPEALIAHGLVAEVIEAVVVDLEGFVDSESLGFGIPGVGGEFMEGVFAVGVNSETAVTDQAVDEADAVEDVVVGLLNAGDAVGPELGDESGCGGVNVDFAGGDI